MSVLETSKKESERIRKLRKKVDAEGNPFSFMNIHNIATGRARKLSGAIIPPPPLDTSAYPGMRTTTRPYTTVCGNRHTVAPRQTILTDGRDLFCPICGTILHAF